MSLLDNLKQLDSKQKGMLVVTIGCLGLVFYLAYTTFFPGGDDSTPSPVPAVKTVTTTTTQQPQVNNNTLAEANIAQTPAQSQSNNNNNTAVAFNNTQQDVQLAKTTAPPPQDLAILAQNQRLQQQYLQLVNEYQLAQLQQKLAQTDSQIAASKVTTTKSLIELKKMEVLLGNGLPVSSSTSTSMSNTTLTQTGTVFAPASQGYQTMFVGATAGQWEAMLSGDNQYYQVSVGMHLPDGSVVTQINNRGVVLTNSSGTPVFLPMNKNLD